MTPMPKEYMLVGFALVGALATIGTALWVQDAEYENVWLYVFCVWLLLYSALEVYLRRKKDNDQ